MCFWLCLMHLYYNCSCWFPLSLWGVYAFDLFIFLEFSWLPMPFSCFLIQCMLSMIYINFSHVSNRLLYFLMSCWGSGLASIPSNSYQLLQKMATNSCQELSTSKQWLEAHGKSDPEIFDFHLIVSSVFSAQCCCKVIQCHCDSRPQRGMPRPPPPGSAPNLTLMLSLLDWTV